MDLWEQMKEDNNSNFYTPSKRDKIYNEYLVPLKARAVFTLYARI